MDLARSSYTRELKIAAMRAMDAGETGGQVARRLEVSPKLLERWRAEWRARGEAGIPGKGNRQSGDRPGDEKRLAELERKIGQMTMENDFLKKPWRISGNITLRPSSVAQLCVPASRASGGSRRGSETALCYRRVEPCQLLPQFVPTGRTAGDHGPRRPVAEDRVAVAGLRISAYHTGVITSRLRAEPQAGAAPDAAGQPAVPAAARVSVK